MGRWPARCIGGKGPSTRERQGASGLRGGLRQRWRRDGASSARDETSRQFIPCYFRRRRPRYKRQILFRITEGLHACDAPYGVSRKIYRHARAPAGLRLMRKKWSYRDEIRSIAMQRNVAYLLHFTQLANLGGIVKHGLLPRRELMAMEDIAYVSDISRLDGNNDAVSVSISKLNKTMFDTKRAKSGHSEWVILGLPAAILWTKNCQFCWRNAAKNEIVHHRGRRDGPWAFNKMFAGSEETRSGLDLSEPTDPQAEVQVMGRIEPDFILGAIVNRQSMVRPVSDILSNLPGDPREVVVEGF